MRLEILGGVLLGGHFLNTMITREDMDEIDLSGTKLPKKAQLLSDSTGVLTKISF